VERIIRNHTITFVLYLKFIICIKSVCKSYITEWNGLLLNYRVTDSCAVDRGLNLLVVIVIDILGHYRRGSLL